MALASSSGLHSADALVYDDGYEKDGVTYFLISVRGVREPSGGAWQVRRRYNDFKRLHDELTRLSVVLPPMPPKSVLRIKLSGSFQEDRRRQLQYVLQTALQGDPSLQNLHELRAFLIPAPSCTPPVDQATAPVVAQAAPAAAQAPPAVQTLYAQPTPVYLQHALVYEQPALVYGEPVLAYGVAALVYAAPSMSDTHHHSLDSHHSRHVAAAAVGGGAADQMGCMMLENALEDGHRDRIVQEVHPGISGTEAIIEESHPHGFIGAERVMVEDVRTNIFGDAKVKQDIVDRDMFGRVTDVREDAMDRDMFGNVTEYSVEAW